MPGVDTYAVLCAAGLPPPPLRGMGEEGGGMGEERGHVGGKWAKKYRGGGQED